MGKSTCALLLERLGLPIIDTDQVARDVVAPGQPALAEIRDAFGPDVLAPGGVLDRARVAALVFGDPQARARLEGILHPRIRSIWQSRVVDWRREGRPGGAVIIPLLFETAAEPAFDKVLCVACSGATQRQRLRERGWTDDQIAGRLAAQLPIEAKILRSDFLVWTETSLTVHEAQLRRVLSTVGVVMPATSASSSPP